MEESQQVPPLTTLSLNMPSTTLTFLLLPMDPRVSSELKRTPRRLLLLDHNNHRVGETAMEAPNSAGIHNDSNNGLDAARNDG